MTRTRNQTPLARKPLQSQRKAELPEVDLFIDPVSPSDQTSSNSNVSPLHLTRAGQSSDWQVNF